MYDGHASFCDNRNIGNFFHNQAHSPVSNWKFDGIWITFIFFSGSTESEIYQAEIVCTGFISRDTGCEIKIYFTSILFNIAGIARQGSIFFLEEISRLLE
jgi:hypothetical protein